MTIIVIAGKLEHYRIKVGGYLKPYVLDDVFWEVFQMPENLKAPIGLRANGAFTVRGLEVYDQYLEIEDYKDVEKIIEELFKECDKEIETTISRECGDIKKFIDYSKGIEKPGLYNSALSEMLFDIKEKKYCEAERLAIYEMGNQRYGHLVNRGKDIYEYIVEFCREKEKQERCQL